MEQRIGCKRWRRVPLKECHMSVTHRSPRTDLAMEAHELASRQGTVHGVEESREEHEGIVVTRVRVRTQAAQRRLGKRKGTYITLDVPGLRHRDLDLQERVTRVLADELKHLLDLPPSSTILVIGLGNEHVTADALGPMVVNKLFVTRHLFEYMPHVLGDGKGYRSIAAVSPGVLGLTGIETSEIVRGIVERVRPDAVIAVDALASRSLSRVNATIQLSDAGIQPGAGVGNNRRALDKESLGVPVIAIGVPTVVEAATIAGDAIELVLNQLREQVPGNAATALFDQLSSMEKWHLVKEVLEPIENNLVVTPKEVDDFMDNVAYIVAKGLNVALHPAMTFEDADLVTH
ncbi:germination protease [Alicyclobacillus hesperidum subsp. aegles]|uniref:GPR endopeptidase n=1 Tax=Alicyclobacillus hesperidum TaxID=89784 RepID=UPI00072AD6E9|nr:GPR endopeptidase [Alicyclobacillus hesperidum]KRW91690.1 spore gernimation protein [Alicyclobacillus tengchongensis]GLG00320.1 germination protease [Alicyclobacillus hesperidum subsp. aegles]